MAAAMTDHIQNNPFGRSTDGHRDDWSAVQIGGSAGGYLASFTWLALWFKSSGRPVGRMFMRRRRHGRCPHLPR